MCFCLNFSVQAEASIHIIKGKVTCEGKGIQGIMVTDGRICVQTDASGNVQPFEVKTGISGNPVGCNIVNLYMTNTPAQVPNITSAPFICFTPIGNGNIRITKVLNLEKNSKYTLTVEIF